MRKQMLTWRAYYIKNNVYTFKDIQARDSKEAIKKANVKSLYDLQIIEEKEKE